MSSTGVRRGARRRRMRDDERRLVGRALLLLRHAGVVVTQRLDRTVGPVVSGNSAVAIVLALREGGPQRPVRLARVAGLTTGGLSKVLDRLEHHELITRGPRRTGQDGRAVLVSLTAKGELTANTLDDVASAALRQVRSELEEVLAIARDVGAPVGVVGVAGGTTALARLSRVGIQLTEAMRRSPMDDHAAILVLCVLDAEHACRPGRLVEVLGLTSGGVTKLVDRLVARGFVERSYGTLDADRRGVTLSITPAGLDELDAVLSLVVGHLSSVGLAVGDLDR